jgi:hypothetical protein
LARALDRVLAAANRYNAVWDIVPDLSRFATYTNFIQGFWFSADLVRAGPISASYVIMVAFLWAWLVVTSELQMAMPKLVAVAQGKLNETRPASLPAIPARSSPTRLRACPISRTVRRKTVES